jgi:signal transduction histidine kinase
MILRLLKWRWWIAGLLVIGLTGLEFLEHDTFGLNIFYDLEFIIFLATIMVSGTLFELLARSNRKLDETLRILDYKHNLILEMSQEEDWDTLTTRIVELPHVHTDAVASALIFCNPDRGTNELIARWKLDERGSESEIGEGVCANCLDAQMSTLHYFKGYDTSLVLGEAVNPAVYCLPIRDGLRTVAMLRFQMADGKKLLPEQVFMLDHVVDELVILLKTSYERKIQADMRIAEANFLQRKDIWRYLHDHLGQNLVYLRFKLDQFSKPAAALPQSEIHTDLVHMRDVANESYLMVRNWLKSRHPESQTLLSDLLIEHARETAERENFEIGVCSEGQPFQIEPSVQRNIYYICREALSNIARHANASKVDVVLNWGPADLTLNITDNGKGFLPSEIDSTKHFGFGIMNERVAELNGRLELQTSLQMGTVLSIWIPFQ